MLVYSKNRRVRVLIYTFEIFSMLYIGCFQYLIQQTTIQILVIFVKYINILVIF